MARSLFSSIEALEARIAPANLTAFPPLAVYHPLIDVFPALGKTSSIIDLGASLDSDPTAGYRTHVEFLTNFDMDPVKPGLQAGKIVIELFDDKAPLTVQNFLDYVNNANANGDYDGTFIHRLASGFVLQAGGFQANNPGQHIVVGESVHNEFDPNDPERANVAGTLAMAKVGGDPNSATSEFFFNLGDNRSSINPTTGVDDGLDHQNGGFTVFAKVVQGMDVVNAIASLPTVTINSFPVPYQNGYDPTSGKTPTPKQLIDFTSVKVLPAKNSTIGNAQYSVVSIMDQDGHASDIVSTNANHTTGLLPNDSLKLTYKPGASGIATVTVKVTDKTRPDADPIYESFQVKLQPDLIAHTGGDTLPLVSVAGDSGVGTIKLVNTGGASAIGTVDVHYYLSHVDGTTTNQDGSVTNNGPDPTGKILEATDLEIGSIMGASINIGSGKSGTLNVPLHIPDGTDMASGQYVILAKVTASDGSTIVESFTDNNVMTDGRTHGFFPGEAKTNLTAIGMSDNLPHVLVPGDTGLAKVGIGNSSSTLASGDVVVNVFLQYDTRVSSQSSLQVDSILLGQISPQHLTLAPGKTMTLAVPIQMPETLNYTDGYYTIGVSFTNPTTGAVIDELTTTDNSVAGAEHVLSHNFGTFSISDPLFFGTVSRKDAPMTYQDGSGNEITLKIAGPGRGVVSGTAAGGIQVSLENTTLASSFSILSPQGVIPVVENVLVGAQTNSPIGALKLGNVAWTGSITAYGGAKVMTLGNTTGDTDHFVGVGAVGKIRPMITMGTVQDLSLTATTTIASLTANSWTDTAGSNTETVNVYGLTTFKILGTEDATGDSRVPGFFEADMRVESPNPAATPAMRTFSVYGTLHNSEVRIAANVGTVSLGAIDTSNFLVGTDVLPVSTSDFNFARTVSNFTVKSLGVGSAVPSFIDSNVAAARFGTVHVIGQLSSDETNNLFGIIADRIASYQRGAGTIFRNLDAPKDLDVNNFADNAQYQVSVLA